MKTTGTLQDLSGLWFYDESLVFNTVGLNTSGFSALPGGLMDFGNNGLGSNAQVNRYGAWRDGEYGFRFISNFSALGLDSDYFTKYGISIRCIRD